MQATSSSVSSGGATSPTKQQPPQGQQQQRQQTIAYDPQMQYYYAAPLPAGAQPMPSYMPQNGNGQPFTAQAYYQDNNGQYVPVGQNGNVPQQQIMVPGQSYIYMAPQQGSQQPQFLYYPQHVGPMPPHTAPMYYNAIPQQGAQMNAEHIPMIQQVPQQMGSSQQPSQRHLGVAHGMEMATTRTAPLTSSTPLPTSLEYETVQRENARTRNLQFRYHRVMDHDELPISDLSVIPSDNHHDDTMSAEKENLALEQRGEKFSRRGFVNQENDNQPANYKTRLCMMHASGTKCDMGPRCKFAHGLKELRSAEVAPVRYPNNKYKTKLCKNFARGGTGFCPYGLRCEFVHPTDKEFQNIPPYQRMMVDEKAYEQDLTPDDYVVARHQPRFARSGGRGVTTPTKVLLKNRNVAGSMMCLSQAGRDGNMGGGDFNNKPNNSQDNLPPHLRRNMMSNRKAHPPMTKRRTSLTTKWTSEENLGHHGVY